MPDRSSNHIQILILLRMYAKKAIQIMAVCGVAIKDEQKSAIELGQTSQCGTPIIQLVSMRDTIIR